MRVARVQISGVLLREVLCLPSDTEVTGSSQCSDGNIEVVLSHPDLPDIPAGQEPPLITPTFRRQDAVVLESWGVQEGS